MTKPKYVFVLGTKLWAEELIDEDISNIWGWNKGHKSFKDYWKYGCNIAIFVIKISDRDMVKIKDSVFSSPNHSAILPLEV
jgi:hypothetical protein